MQGMTSVMILRRDKQLGYMLMPAQKMYSQMDFQKAQQQSGAQPADQVEITEVGSDTIDGQATTKYKLIMKDGSAGGFMWFTKDGIMMKMDTVVKNGRNKSRMTITLKNVKIGCAGCVALRSARRLQRDAVIRRRRHGRIRWRRARRVRSLIAARTFTARNHRP